MSREGQQKPLGAQENRCQNYRTHQVDYQPQMVCYWSLSKSTFERRVESFLDIPRKHRDLYYKLLQLLKIGSLGKTVFRLSMTAMKATGCAG